MANLNKVMLIGNLTRDPELRYTPKGNPVAKFSIAVNRGFKGPDGTWQEKTDFIRITVFGRAAENCGKYLVKGRSVFVEGRLEQQTWETQDGQKRSSLEVIALAVQFLSGNREDQPRRSDPQSNYQGSSGSQAFSEDAPATTGGSEKPASDKNEYPEYDDVPF